MIGKAPAAIAPTIQVFVEYLTSVTRESIKSAWVADTLQEIDINALAGGFAETLAGNLADLFSIAATDNGTET